MISGQKEVLFKNFKKRSFVKRNLNKYLTKGGWSEQDDWNKIYDFVAPKRPHYFNESNGLSADSIYEAAKKQNRFEKDKLVLEEKSIRETLISGGWKEVSSNLWSKRNWSDGYDSNDFCFRTTRQAYKIEYPISKS